MADVILTERQRIHKRGQLVVRDREGRTTDLTKHRLYIAERPRIPYPTPQMDFHTFKGRDGYLDVNYGTYQPIETTVVLSALDTNQREVEERTEVLNRLTGQPLEFDFYNYPTCTYEGIIRSIDQGNESRYASTVTLDLILQPKRILDRGVRGLNKGDRVIFDKGEVEPIFEIRGAGDIVLKTGTDVRFEHMGLNQTIFIDSQSLKTYMNPTKNSYVPMHHLKVDHVYPVIESGKPITWTGSVSLVRIHYKWVCL